LYFRTFLPVIYIFNIILDCGRPYTPNQALILEGVEAVYGSAPWNVGVYRKNNKNSFDLICGGSLIAQNLVVSGMLYAGSIIWYVQNHKQIFFLAAHCFWQERLIDRILINDGTYKIAVGKYKSDIAIKDNAFTQIVDVTQIKKKNWFGSLNILLKII